MKITVICLLLVFVAEAGFGRFVQIKTYRELYDDSDLVVIAQPRASQDTAERNVLANTDAVGVSTEFEVALTLKGERPVERITLHHYRYATERIANNGPVFERFNCGADSTSYLLFLKKEADGRYAPVDGQTEPGIDAVQRLSGVARIRNGMGQRPRTDSP